jgi:hypothetical protein
VKIIPRLLGAAALALLSTVAAVAETRLIMFEQEGCAWCQRWDREIGAIYGKTEEGRKAPLTRLHIRAPLPTDVALADRAHYTPTFVLIEDGVEVSRITGYPGEDFFWALLDQMLEKVAVDATKS